MIEKEEIEDKEDKEDKGDKEDKEGKEEKEDRYNRDQIYCKTNKLTSNQKFSTLIQIYKINRKDRKGRNTKKKTKIINNINM